MHDPDSCIYCGDADFTADLVADFTDDDPMAVCRSGCGLVFTMDDIDPDDLAFGFHIEDLFGDPERFEDVPTGGLL